MKSVFSTLSQKWPEYLIESLVIVASILGAFALDNWNEARLEKIEEAKILRSVKKDLENTIHEFHYLNEVRETIIAGTKGLFSFSTSNELPKEKLDSLMALTFNVPTFNNKMGSIQLLFSSGKINIISNDSLREKLIAWPGFIDDMVEEEQYAIELLYGSYYHTAARYINIDDIFSKAKSSSLIGRKGKFETYPKTTIVSDYENMLKDKTLLNDLRIRALQSENVNKEVESLIERAREIIVLIDVRLNE